MFLLTTRVKRGRYEWEKFINNLFNTIQQSYQKHIITNNRIHNPTVKKMILMVIFECLEVQL